jgi:chaperonin GroES
MSYHAISVIGSLRYLDHVANPSTDISSSIAVLFDRLLVKIDSAEGERRSRSGILIPATAQLAKRLTWASVVAVGPHVRAVSAGQRILFSPDDQYEVEVDGEELVLLRERDVHAVAKQGTDPSAGLYL